MAAYYGVVIAILKVWFSDNNYVVGFASFIFIRSGCERGNFGADLGII